MTTVLPPAGAPAPRRSIAPFIIGGVVLLFVIGCIVLAVINWPKIQEAAKMNLPVAVQKSATPTLGPTLSVEEQVKATVQAQNGNGGAAEPTAAINIGLNPTATQRVANPTQRANPTATQRPALPTATLAPTQSPDEYYRDWIRRYVPETATLKVTSTPVPGAGPYEPEIPLVPYTADANDAFDFMRALARAYREEMNERGVEPTLYGYANDVVVGIVVKERQMTGCSVQTEGGLWINSNLEDCQGSHLVVTSGQVFVMAEFADLRVDNSKVTKVPFWNGSTLGDWGLWLASGEMNLTTGLIYIPAGTVYTLEPAKLK